MSIVNIDGLANRFLGAPYPIVKDAKGYFHTINDLDTLKADMLILLMTNFGERIMIPEYGANLRSLVFDPNDAALAAKARSLIIQAIGLWEPRVTVDSIDVTTGSDVKSLSPNDDLTEVESVLSITIMFKDPRNIQDVQSLTLHVPLA